MTKVTKESLSARIAELESGTRSIKEDYQLEAYRMLLAAMQREPVGEVVLGDYDDCGDYPDAKVVCIASEGQAGWDNFRNGTALYAEPQLSQPVVVDERAAFNAWNNEDNLPVAGVGAKNAAWLAWQARARLSIPQAPVVPDEMTFEKIAEITASHGYEYSINECICAAYWWNACRAAMPQGTEPVSNHDELPLDYLQGHKDGLEWAAQLAEANHPQTGDWIYDDPVELAKAIRKGPDMPELKSVPADTDDNFYSWFSREWEQYYQPNQYSLSAKKHLGAIAESAWFACRNVMIQRKANIAETSQAQEE